MNGRSSFAGRLIVSGHPKLKFRFDSVQQQIRTYVLDIICRINHLLDNNSIYYPHPRMEFSFRSIGHSVHVHVRMSILNDNIVTINTFVSCRHVQGERRSVVIWSNTCGHSPG